MLNELSPLTEELLQELAGRFGRDPGRLADDLLLPALEEATRDYESLCRAVAEGLPVQERTQTYASADELRVALTELLLLAFGGVERGSGVLLHEAEVIDNYGSDEERARARQLDTETRWQDVPDADIEQHGWALSFLDPDGLRYYAPAYMVWALKHYKASGSMSCDSIIYTLEPHLNTSHHEWSMTRFAMFTPDQRKAICCFLRFMAGPGNDFADGVVAARALKDYWGQFC